MRSITPILDEMRTAPVRPDEEDDFGRCETLRAELEQTAQQVGDVFEATGGTRRSTVASEVGVASVSPDRAVLLYRVAVRLAIRKAVEFGSAFGVSGSYLACALRRSGDGMLVTVEGSPSRHTFAAKAMESVAPGRARAVRGFFDDHLHELDDAELFFLDGNHRSEPTRKYVDNAVKRMKRPGVIVLDDVVPAWPEVVDVWGELSKDARFSASGLSGGVGVLCLGDTPLW